jgi:hypothetical protein
MTHLILVLVVLGSTAVLAAQEEKPVPKDSARVTLPGCARGRTFIVGDRVEGEPVRGDIPPGRRLRLSGPKKMLDEIKARESYMIEVTGLVRKAQLGGPGGVAVAGGRVRIGGGTPAAPMSDARRDPLYNEVVIDLEAWMPLPNACPSK